MATILVIDDEQAIRTLLSTALQLEGHNVMEASTGRQGLAVYRQSPADLVILDMLMPVLDGLETIIELTREFLDVKAIAMSGVDGDQPLLSRARLLGARQSLRKPFGIEELLSASGMNWRTNLPTRQHLHRFF
jgi:CheY-like chemotaxis protein